MKIDELEKYMNKYRYILGLDLGIASVGWALVSVNENEEPIGLLDCGVRTFERAEVPKTGESLAKARRDARVCVEELEGVLFVC
ncbi:hypothetical protein [Basilea psittacipulmonis]|uniref:hypothetical protein n=1 Tax=Basilea psittacipulmonis TaxID=1472345 RepID=UPI000B0C7C10|nr:hypothetical protein [Basilea psittacipulmonis]